MRARLSVVAALLLLALAAPAQGKPSVGVLGIEAIDEGDAAALQQSSDLARKLTDALRAGAVASGQYEIAPGGARDLGEMKLLSDCLDEATPCMAAIGKEVGADILIWGALERGKDGFTLKMRSMTIVNPKAPTKTTKPLANATASIDGVVGQILGDLLNLPLPGAIIVTSNAEIGTVFVNGQPRGALASGIIKVEGVAAGSVTVSIKAEGFADGEKTVDLKAGATAEVKIDLPATGGVKPINPVDDDKDEPSEARPGKTSRILFWTSLAVTAGGAVAFTVTGLQVKTAEQDNADQARAWQNNPTLQATYPIPAGGAEDVCSIASLPPAIKDSCDKGKQKALMTNAFIGVTAVAAIASGWFYYKGFIQPGTAKETNAVGRLQVIPVIGPGAAAINATIQF